MCCFSVFDAYAIGLSIVCVCAVMWSSASLVDVQCHEFDELRFDVRVYDSTYFLRAPSVLDKQQWIEVIEANKVCVRVCARACMRVCACVCMHMYGCMCVGGCGCLLSRSSTTDMLCPGHEQPACTGGILYGCARLL